MSPDAREDMLAEEERIRNVYAGRHVTVAPDRYSLLRAPNLYRLQQVERTLVRELGRAKWKSLATCRILDVGCGAGFWLREFARFGAAPDHLYGVDLLPDRIASARSLSPSGVTFTAGSAADLQYPNESFDLVTQFTVFSSILDDSLRMRIAAEMRRVLKPDGRILSFDFHYDNPRNASVRGMKRREIARLFPDCSVRFTNVGLAPPIANFVGSAAVLYQMLCEIPWLCTHHLASITPVPDTRRLMSPRRL